MHCVWQGNRRIQRVFAQLIENLEPRYLLNGVVYHDGDTFYGANASPSTALNTPIDASSPWTLTLSNLPGHTQITNGVFGFTLVSNCDSGCGSGDGCGTGCDSGGSGDSQWSITLDIAGQERTIEGDAAPSVAWAVQTPNLPVNHTADSLTITMTANNLPDGMQWEVTGGEVDMTTNVGVFWLQDADAASQTAGVAEFMRDGNPDQPLDVYYGLGGSSAQFGVENGSDAQGNPTYSPANADFTGPTPVDGHAGLYMATIPAGSDVVQVQFKPIVPDIVPEPGDKTILPTVGYPLPENNVIGYDIDTNLPGTASGVEHKLKLVVPAVSDASKAAINAALSNQDANALYTAVSSGSSPAMASYLSQQQGNYAQGSAQWNMLQGAINSNFPLHLTASDNYITFDWSALANQYAGSTIQVQITWGATVGGNGLVPNDPNQQWSNTTPGIYNSGSFGAANPNYSSITFKVNKVVAGPFSPSLAVTITGPGPNPNTLYFYETIHTNIVSTATTHP
jgi:hypothetical protein